jgi:hypothetical protein
MTVLGEAMDEPLAWAATVLKQQEETNRTMRGFQSLVEALSARIDANEQKADGRFTKLEKEMVNLNGAVASLRASVGSAASTMSSPGAAFSSASMVGATAARAASAATTSGQRAEWCPSTIEVKGWVTSWEDTDLRHREMITSAQVEELITGLGAILTQEMKNKIDEEQTKRATMGRVLHAKVVLKMKAGVNKDEVWRLRQYLEDNKARLQGAPPGMRLTVQTAPWRQHYVLACAKGIGALETMGISRGSLKVEIGPTETKIFWMGEGGARPQWWEHGPHKVARH